MKIDFIKGLYFANLFTSKESSKYSIDYVCVQENTIYATTGKTLFRWVGPVPWKELRDAFRDSMFEPIGASPYILLKPDKKPNKPKGLRKGTKKDIPEGYFLHTDRSGAYQYAMMESLKTT